MPLCPASNLLMRLHTGAEQRFLSDGGMGSELIQHGIPPSRILYANTEQAALVRTIHESYLKAGADILSANTFGLPDRDNADDWMAQITAGEALAADAARQCEREIWVWTTLAPDAVTWVLTGNRHWPATDGAGDALLIETCVTLPQAVQAIQAVRQTRLGHPSLLAVTCHFCRDGRMPDGSLPEDVARALTRAGADIIGGNCGDMPEYFLMVAERMRQVTALPLLFQPNAGLPRCSLNDLPVYTVTAKRFAHLAIGLWNAGVNIVGGCCGTTPTHIRHINSMKPFSAAHYSRPSQKPNKPGREENEETAAEETGTCA